MFIKDTDCPCQYGIISNECDEIYENELLKFQNKISHKDGIEHALRLFKSSDATHFLLLDSDCWPVRSDWMTILNSMLSDKYMYAAPMRVENFDIFPHPCAFYMKREFLQHADFNFKKMTNLLGYEVSDVGMAMPQFIGGKQSWLPLLKSNYRSPHPIYASVYSDLFYHHCAGSRGIGFRSVDYGVYDHIVNRHKHRKIYQELTSQLIASPRKFIESLRGVEIR